MMLTNTSIYSKCHSGRACVYDVASEWKWRPDIRKHRIPFVIEEVIKKWDGVPECVPEQDCVDCSHWEMVEVPTSSKYIV
jgi:lipase ATG15